MDRLTYTELLCLRVSEGLGTERDFSRLRAAGIDPTEWTVLPQLIQSALKPTEVPEVSGSVCDNLDIECIDIKSAIEPQVVPDLQNSIAEQLELPEVQAPMAPILLDESSEDDSDEIVMLSVDQKVDSPEEALPELETEPLTAALEPRDVPNMADAIMASILASAEESTKSTPILSLVEEDSDESSDEGLIVLETATILEEPELTEDLLETSLPLSEALSPTEIPSLVEAVMEDVSRLEIPSKSHLRLVSEEQGDIPHVYRERIGDVDVEIQDISSPRVIDGDSAAGNGSFWLLLAAVAAAAVLIVQNFISESSYQAEETANPQVAQSIEILDLNSDDMTQIQVDGSMTIIFIDEGE